MADNNNNNSALQAQAIIDNHIDSMDDNKDKDEKRAKAAQVITALRMQERQESREEIAQYIYEYKGRALSNNNNLLCPGDYLILNNGGDNLGSARGANIALDTDGLERMLHAGVLDRVFYADEPSSPDFTGKLDAILDRMAIQAEYRDASKYFVSNSGLSGIAAYGDNNNGFNPTAAVMRSGGEFLAAAGKELGEDMAGMLEGGIETAKDIAKGAAEEAGSLAGGVLRECSYEEFNPGGLDIKAELGKNINTDRENAGEIYKKMIAEIKDDANIKPKAISANNKKSPFAELSAAISDDKDDKNIGAADFSPLANTKAMRRMG